jgi:hypothetical protein
MEPLSMSAPADLAGALSRALYELARKEEDLAAAEGACVPYWEPCPSSVYGHLAAAEALRHEAENLTVAA